MLGVIPQEFIYPLIVLGASILFWRIIPPPWRTLAIVSWIGGLGLGLIALVWAVGQAFGGGSGDEVAPRVLAVVAAGMVVWPWLFILARGAIWAARRLQGASIR
jgi:hypothetical protein